LDSSLPSARAAPKKLSKGLPPLQKYLQLAEDIFHVHRASTMSTAAWPAVTETIILGFLSASLNTS